MVNCIVVVIAIDRLMDAQTRLRKKMKHVVVVIIVVVVVVAITKNML